MAASVCKLTQLWPHRSGVGLTQLDEHTGRPVLGDGEQFAVGAAHLVVQLPQDAGSLRLVSQPLLPLPAQWANPGIHDVDGIEQTPITHWTDAAVLTLGRVLQLKPQVPQLSGSVLRSTHLLVHRSGAGATQLDEHIGTPVVVEHSAVGATHLLVQLPHVAGTLRLVSQPLLPVPVQWANPPAHDVAGIEHTPLTHWTEAPGLTLGSAPQLKPHEPQLSGSVLRSTHLVVHRSGAGATQLDEHIGAPLVVEHSPVGAVHLVVQLPHDAALLRLVSHPRSGLPAQCAKPEAHDVGGTEQTPDMHITGAPALTLGSAAQLWPHDPQLAGSDLKSTHRAPHRSGDGATQLDEQAGAPVVVEHSAVGATQAVPHLPQFVAVERLVSQPSSDLVEQWAKPVAHALGGT